VWRRFKVGEVAEKKTEIDAEIEWDVIEKNIWCRWIRMEVLSEKTRGDDNF